MTSLARARKICAGTNSPEAVLQPDGGVLSPGRCSLVKGRVAGTESGFRTPTWVLPRTRMLNIVPVSPELLGEEDVSCFPSSLGVRAGMGEAE